jgi:hypothetical protein
MNRHQLPWSCSWRGNWPLKERLRVGPSQFTDIESVRGTFAERTSYILFANGPDSLEAAIVIGLGFAELGRVTSLFSEPL